MEHDRPGDNVSVQLKVVSTDGRVVWTTEKTDNSGSGVCMVDWNLTDTNGAIASPGIYLVYVMLKDANGISHTAVNKLIIVRN